MLKLVYFNGDFLRQLRRRRKCFTMPWHVIDFGFIYLGSPNYKIFVPFCNSVNEIVAVTFIFKKFINVTFCFSVCFLISWIIRFIKCLYWRISFFFLLFLIIRFIRIFIKWWRNWYFILFKWMIHEPVADSHLKHVCFWFKKPGKCISKFFRFCC